jgi:hypothetical protein
VQKLRQTLAALVATLLSCSLAEAQMPSTSASDPDSEASPLIAAAEPFEKLTENAFVVDKHKLGILIAKAKSSAAGASKFMSISEAQALSKYVAAIDVARAENNPADLAIAAVEGYRTLVSIAGGQQKVPKQVSLLDYSGFRFQADIKAKPIRWSDASNAVDFAFAEWQQIADRVDDLKLRAKMSAALAAMRLASHNKNAMEAMSAATRQLDLVDHLEHYFDR